MRRFAIVGQRATASPAFSLIDIPGTGGRIDVLLRCLRAALMVSHGLRYDTLVYLVLLGGPRAPRTIRIDGAVAKYLRPDEHQLAILVQKILSIESEGPGFVEKREGIAVANGGLSVVLDECGDLPRYVLAEDGVDVRKVSLEKNALFIVGDDRGFDAAHAALLAGVARLSVGPVSVQADDAVVLLHNELDRH